MKITIPIIPKAQKRPRFSNRSGFVKAYKDKGQVQEEIALEALLLPHCPLEPLQGQVMLKVGVYLPMPKSKTHIWKMKAASGEIRPTSKPDLDNFIKHVKDCLTRANFWRDDAQVVGYLQHTGKYYSVRPRWELEIVEI